MTTYKAIHGKLIQHLASDPDSAAYEGQIWFNTTSSDYKTIQKAAGAWATGATGNTVRVTLAGGGTQTAGWVAGGESPESPSASALHEQYNGSAWSEAADLQTGRLELYGVGSQAAGLVAGGATPTTTAISEEWNGSAWAEGNNLNLARKRGASGGTQTAAFATGGTPTGVNNEIYNGTSWAEDANLNGARYYIKGSGTSTAGLVAGGANPSDAVVATAEAWNGTAWTEVGDLNTARAYGTAAFGTQTATIHAGGDAGPGSLALTEQWDGSSWTEVGDLLTGIRYTQGAGSASSGIQMFGYTTAKSAVTQEWNFTSTLGAGAWASGGNLSVARGNAFGSGTGTQTAAKVSGGHESTVKANSEDYDGSSWTEVGDLNAGRYGGGELGTQAAAIFIAGNPAGGEPHRSKVTETFDGTSWTEVNDLQGGQDKAVFGKAGTQTAAFIWAGHQFPGLSTTAEDWDGTNWTSGTNVSTNREQGGSSGSGGSNTAAFYIGGGPPESALHEQWNGSAWAEAGDLNTARRSNFAMATNNDYAVTGGGEGTGTTNAYTLVEQYDGTSWTEVANTNVESYNNASSPSGTAGLMIGQTDSPYVSTEEWTVGQNIKVLTD